MLQDEKDIRAVVANWMEATRKGDLTTVLSLMAEDVLFTVPGREPFDKATFATAFPARMGVGFDGESRIVELNVLGDWEYLRSYMTVRIEPPSGNATLLQGYTLTILRKEAGAWLVTRDANMIAPAQ